MFKLDEDVEVRTIPATELRAVLTDTPKIEGYAAMFMQMSEDLGGFREQIAPGSFRSTIAEDDVWALWNHNRDLPLGRLKAGTLKLSEDSRGLQFLINPPKWAGPQMESIARGDVDQMSFTFKTPNGGAIMERSNGQNIRTLQKVKLLDVSPVNYPAYPQTVVQVRALMMGAGLPVDELAAVLGRSKDATALSSADVELVRSSVKKLEGLLPKFEGSEEHGKLLMYRRKLALALVR